METAWLRGTGRRVTRMQESERQMKEEQTQRQEESQEVAKSRSPGSGKFQGWGSTESPAKSDLGRLHWVRWPYLKYLKHRKPVLRMNKCLIPGLAVTGPGRGLPSGTFYPVAFIFTGLAPLI